MSLPWLKDTTMLIDGEAVTLPGLARKQNYVRIYEMYLDNLKVCFMISDIESKFSSGLRQLRPRGQLLHLLPNTANSRFEEDKVSNLRRLVPL